MSNFPIKTNNAGAAVSMQINVAHGVPDITKSVAQIVNPVDDIPFKTNVKSGTTVRWQVLSVDANENKIKMDQNKEALKVQLYTYKLQLDGEEQATPSTPKLSPDQSYLYFDMELKKMGKYTLQAFYNG
jgi:hypothetical protein